MKSFYAVHFETEKLHKIGGSNVISLNSVPSFEGTGDYLVMTGVGFLFLEVFFVFFLSYTGHYIYYFRFISRVHFT